RRVRGRRDCRPRHRGAWRGGGWRGRARDAVRDRGSLMASSPTERASEHRRLPFGRALGPVTATVALASCMTMTPHRLGPVADPATERQMDQLAAQGETFAEIQKPVGPLDPRLGAYRVLGSEPGVLMLE